MLEAYPNNPGLLLIRALAENLCRDRNEDIVKQNFSAYLEYANDESTWNVPIDIISKTAVELIKTVSNDNLPFSKELTIILCQFIPIEQMETFRAIIKDLPEESSLYPMYIILGNLNNKLKRLF
jgi:hypothetical protein